MVAQDKSAFMCAKTMERGRTTFLREAFTLKWKLLKCTQNVPSEKNRKDLN